MFFCHFTRETSFVTSCLLSRTTKGQQNTSTMRPIPKERNLLLKRSNVFLVQVDPPLKREATKKIVAMLPLNVNLFTLIHLAEVVSVCCHKLCSISRIKKNYPKMLCKTALPRVLTIQTKSYHRRTST